MSLIEKRYTELLNDAFDPESFRREGHRVVDILADFLAASTPEKRPRVMAYEEPEAMLASWAGRFGAAPGVPFPELLPEILARSNDLLHPRFVGHQCTTSLPLAALGGLVGEFLNNASAIYEMGPVNVAMERQLVRWMTGLAGWEADGDGVFTNGGTIGNLTALLAARQATAGGDVWGRGVGSETPAAILVPETCHYSVKRAVAVMGLGEDAAIPVSADARFHTRPDDFARAYDEAVRRGRRPVALVANACSTATGSFDDLEAIAAFARDRGLWFHVDGAHGAAVLLSPKYRSLVRGLERADSFIWDAHKNMLIPALATAVLFREGGRSYEAFSAKASYLFERSAREEWYNYAHRTLECTKTMMGLRLFIALAAYGTDFFAGYRHGRLRPGPGLRGPHPGFRRFRDGGRARKQHRLLPIYEEGGAGPRCTPAPYPPDASRARAFLRRPGRASRPRLVEVHPDQSPDPAGRPRGPARRDPGRRLTPRPQRSGAAKVSPWSISPVSYPLRNQRTRCSDVPWVNASGTT